MRPCGGVNPASFRLTSRPLIREGGRECLVEIYAAIRRFVFIEGNSRRQAGRVFRLSRGTIAKMCRYLAPPAYVRSKAPKRPKLEPLLRVIDAILRDGRQDGAGTVLNFVFGLGTMGRKELSIVIEQKPARAVARSRACRLPLGPILDGRSDRVDGKKSLI